MAQLDKVAQPGDTLIHDPAPAEDCADCRHRPAVGCEECRQALARLDQPGGFASVPRHPEQGRSCRLCGAGVAVWCVECLLATAADHRRRLLQGGSVVAATATELRSPHWQAWTQNWVWGGIGRS
jgi:hypothetical protein